MILPIVALEVVRSEPQIFGSTSWKLMRAVSRLPWLIWIGLVVFSGWNWKWLVLDFFVAWILGHCAYRGEVQTAIDAVSRQCIEDPTFYERMVLSGQLLILEAEVASP
jgi:hypothetical protein